MTRREEVAMTKSERKTVEGHGQRKREQMLISK